MKCRNGRVPGEREKRGKMEINSRREGEVFSYSESVSSRRELSGGREGKGNHRSGSYAKRTRRA